MTDHPITPPPELFTEWLSEALLQHDAKSGTVAAMVAAKAAQWGADQELEACCKWLHWQNLATHSDLIPSLRAARRPKPPSLKEQALAVLKNSPVDPEDETLQLSADAELIIRRALEALDD